MRNPKLYLLVLICFSLPGCDSTSSVTTENAVSAAVENTDVEKTDAVLSADTLRKWTGSCALCHVTGNGGAPRVGNADEWEARLTQSPEILLAHTIEGFNNMPPLGYCMSCEQKDLVSMINFMTEGL